MAKKKKRKRAKPKRKKSQTAEERDILHRSRIRVIGIGGGGSSIITEIASQLKRVDFVAANTDLQALKEAARKTRIFPFGQNLTRGLGCGMDPRLGQRAAREEKQKIAKLFKGIDLAILVACLGGGTGSGATPEFAKIARDLGVMTLGIFTLPFRFEGGRRAQIAKSSLEKIIPNLNTLSIIPNENIFRIIDKNTPVLAAFSAINQRLADGLRGLIEMVYLPGLINIDFADLKTILEGKGKLSYLNSSQARGANRAQDAVKELLKNPLNEYNIRGAEKMLFNITAPHDLGMREVGEISTAISDFNRRAKIIFGISQDNGYKDKIRITLLAVGCGKEPKVKPKPATKPIKPKPRRKPRRKPRPKIKPKPKQTKSKPKNKPKHKPKSKKMKIKIRTVSSKIKPEASEGDEPIKEQEKIPTRKNAIDLKKETEKTAEELLEQEKKWDTPAFLRRQQDGENS